MFLHFALMAKTPIMGVRTSPELRRAAMAQARSEGLTLSDVIRDFLRGYVEQRPANARPLTENKKRPPQQEKVPA